MALRKRYLIVIALTSAQPGLYNRSMLRLTLSFFGSMDILLNGRPMDHLNAKTQALLCYLAVESDHPHRRESLVGLLWPEQPEEAARNSLRQAVYQLQHALGEGFLLITPQTVQFNPASDHSLDVAQFTAWITECESHPHRSSLTCHACIQRLQGATDLYRGALLASFFLKDSSPFEEWVVVKREQLARTALATLQRLAAYHARRGEFVQMEQLARRQLALDAFCEEAHHQLMRALAWSGQRNAALAQYAVYRELLKQEFGLEPSRETTELYEQIRAEALAPPHLPPAARLPLPLTSFVGRQREIGQVHHLLDTTRLLTLTGAGGCGKTRLAIEAARSLAEEFPDGVWYVDLAPLADPDLVLPSAAAALGVREQPGAALHDQVLDYVQAQQLLLVLDNCEHLRAACAQLADGVLRSAPQAQLLVTSRETFDIEGETVYHVPPLQIPEHDHSVQALAGVESVELFVARARTIRPNFDLTDANAAAVARICQQLDGIPLAIELAAARVKVLTVQQIAGRLQDTLALLTQGSPMALPRHQTLQATLDWSHALLAEPERILFRRLAVFAGSFTLEAVEAICGDEGVEENQVLDVLSGLVSKSLVAAEPSGAEERFRLHEVARQYAHVKLIAAGKEARVRNRHLDFYGRRLAEAMELNTYANAVDPLDWLTQEYGNLWAAVEWSANEAGDAPSGWRLSATLDRFWEYQTLFAERQGWLERLLAHTGAAESPAVRARALCGAGWAAFYRCDYAATRLYWEQALALNRTVDNKSSIAWTLERLGCVLIAQRDYAAAVPLLQESLALHRALDDRFGLTAALCSLGYAVLQLGDVAQARLLLEESLVLLRGIKFPYQESRSRYMLGQVALCEGNYAQARSLYAQALTILAEMGHLWSALYPLDSLGRLAAAEQQFERAARLFAIVEQLCGTLGTALVPTERVEHERAVAVVRAALGEPAFAAAWAAGRALTLEQAIAYALQDG